MVLLQRGPGCHLHPQAIARFRRGGLRLGWTSPSSPTRAARLGHNAIAARMRPPGVWPAASSSRAPALLRRDSRCGLRLTRNPLGWPWLAVGHDGFGCLGRRSGRGRRLLRRQWARMPHHTAERCACAPAVALLALPLPAHTVSRPTPRGRGLRPPRLLPPEGQGGVLLAPGVAGLADGTGARASRDEGDLLLETPAQRAATLRLTIRDAPPPPLQAPGQTRCKRHGRVPTIAALALTPTKAPGAAASPTHAQTEKHLCEGGTPVFALPVGRSRRPQRLRFVLIGPIEPKGRGVLRQPGRWEGRDLQGSQGDRAQHPVEMGRTQRLQDRPSAVIMEGGSCSPRVPEPSQAPLFQPCAHFVERRRPIQHGEPQGCAPTPTRAAMRRRGRDQVVEHRCHLQTP
jgi:hypothetical protein